MLSSNILPNASNHYSSSPNKHTFNTSLMPHPPEHSQTPENKLSSIPAIQSKAPNLVKIYGPRKSESYRIQHIDSQRQIPSKTPTGNPRNETGSRYFNLHLIKNLPQEPGSYKHKLQDMPHKSEGSKFTRSFLLDRRSTLHTNERSRNQPQESQLLPSLTDNSVRTGGGSFLNSSEKKLVQPSLANPFKLELPAHSVKKLEHTRLSRNEGLSGESYKFNEFMTEKKPGRRKQDNPNSFYSLSRTFEVLSPSVLIGYEGVPQKSALEEELKQRAREIKEEEKRAVSALPVAEGKRESRGGGKAKKEEEQQMLKWNISRKIRMFTKRGIGDESRESREEAPSRAVKEEVLQQQEKEGYLQKKPELSQISSIEEIKPVQQEDKLWSSRSSPSVKNGDILGQFFQRSFSNDLPSIGDISDTFSSTKREREERQKRALALKIYNEISDDVKPSFFFDIHHREEDEEEELDESQSLQLMQRGFIPKQINTPGFNESVETFSFGGGPMASGQQSPGVHNSGELILSRDMKPEVKQGAIKLPSRFIKKIQGVGSAKRGQRFQHIKFRGEQGFGKV